MNGAGTLFTRNRKVALALTFGLYGAAVTAVYFFIDREAVHKALALPFSIVITMLALSLVNYSARAWRWLFFSKQLRLDVPMANNSLYYFSGYALTATPGKVGEAFRLWLLKAGHAVGYVRSLPLMFADRLADMWAILVLVFASMSSFAVYRWQSIAMGTAIVALSIPVVFPRLLLPLTVPAFRWLPSFGRALVRIRKVIRSLADSLRPQTYLTTLLPSVLGWLAECAALYLVVSYFDGGISLMEATFVFSFSMLVGAISMLPGGLGSTEATMVILLRALGVDLDTALAATAIVRITTFWFAVSLGLACTPAALHAAERARVRMSPDVSRA